VGLLERTWGALLQCAVLCSNIKKRRSRRHIDVHQGHHLDPDRLAGSLLLTPNKKRICR
jgi:hypothetical protein